MNPSTMHYPHPSTRLMSVTMSEQIVDTYRLCKTGKNETRVQIWAHLTISSNLRSTKINEKEIRKNRT